MSNEAKNTRIVTGVGTLNHPSVEKPTSYHFGQEPKFSAVLIINKDEVETINQLHTAINNAIDNGYNTIWKGIDIGELKTPIKDGDMIYPNKKEYSNSIFISATSKFQPGMVNNYLCDLHPKEIYAGCKVRLSITCYPYFYQGTCGIGINLNNIMKVSEGEKISKIPSAQDDFAHVVK